MLDTKGYCSFNNLLLVCLPKYCTILLFVLCFDVEWNSMLQYMNIAQFLHKNLFCDFRKLLSSHKGVLTDCTHLLDRGCMWCIKTYAMLNAMGFHSFRNLLLVCLPKYCTIFAILCFDVKWNSMLNIAQFIRKNIFCDFQMLLSSHTDIFSLT